MTASATTERRAWPTVTLALAVCLMVVGCWAQGADAVAGLPPGLATLARLWIHQGWLHLLGNTLALLVLGTALEQRCGGGLVLLVWLGAGIVGALTSHWLDPTRISLGASGAVYGLVGALLASTWRFPMRSPGLVRLALIALLVSGMQAVKMGLPIDRAAHAGGAAAGFILCYRFARPSTVPQSADSLSSSVPAAPARARQSVG